MARAFDWIERRGRYFCPPCGCVEFLPLLAFIEGGRP